MKWLASNIQIILGLGLFFVLASFVRIWFVRPNSRALQVGIFLLCLAGIGGSVLLNGPPEKGKDIVDEHDDGNLPDIPDSALDRLRLPWNSENDAKWPAAETLANLSDVAYMPPYQADKEYQALGFGDVMPFVEGSMIGYVVTGEDVTVVVFRGTDFGEVSDWMANLSTAAAETEHGSIHKGFHAAYQSMKWQIEDILKERKTTHLWITGHSLGGALALVCAYDFVANENRHIDGVITFGQPMIARKQLAEYLDGLLVGKYARFVNRDDIVPKVPPNHSPSGSLVWFTDNGLKRSRVRKVVYGTPSPDVPFPTADVPMASPDEAEIKPLSEQEFRNLQNKLKAENAMKERLPEGTPMQGPPQGPVDDHLMWEYVSKVRMLLGLN